MHSFLVTSSSNRVTSIKKLLGKREENETKRNQFPPSQPANTDMKCFKSYKADSASTTELFTKSFTHTVSTLKG